MFKASCRNIVWSSVAAVALVGLTPPADAAFLEDFTGWANGPSGFLFGPEANTDGWTLRQTRDEQYRISGDTVYIEHATTASGQARERTAGKAHGQDLAGVAQIALSFEVRLSANLNPAGDNSEVWVADSLQNGYGLQATRIADQANTLAIMKVSGNTTPFGQGRIAASFYTGPEPVAYTATPSLNFEGLQLRIEPTQEGVLLTAWSNKLGSYDAPLLQVVDTGTEFDNSPVLDLTTLEHAAFGFARSTTSGGLVRLDNIVIDTVIPEPGVGAAIGAASLLVLRRRRHA